MLSFIRNKYHPLFRLRKTRWFRHVQNMCDSDVCYKKHGISISLKLLRDASIWMGSESEKHSELLVKKIFKENKIDVFFDIGANVGLYSWLALSNGVREVFIAEADTENQRLIYKTIRKNKLKNCFVLPFAIGENVDTLEFLKDSVSGATGSLVNDCSNEYSLHQAYSLNEASKVLTIPLDTFSDYVMGKNPLLKIDVEGAEHLVINGAYEFIRTNKPLILMECFEQDKLESILSTIGYKSEALNENFNYLLSPE